MGFGTYIRDRREELSSARGRRYTLRYVAGVIEVQSSYLSKVEREHVPPPSEATIKKLAVVLEEDEDLLLALAKKVPADIREIICSDPEFYCALIRNLESAPPEIVEKCIAVLQDEEPK